jgi:uncharacterized protein YraI
MRKYRVGFYLLALLFALMVGLLPSLLVRADFGSNWTAAVFNNTDLSGNPVATLTGVPAVNFNWTSGAPVINGQTVPGVGTDNFSIRFTSTQNFAAGTYNFILASDDGARVLIDGATVLDRFVGRPLTTDNFTQTLTAGAHSIQIDYFEGIDQAQIQFQWFLQSASGTAAPGFTATPAATAVPALTVSVTSRGLSLRTGPYLGASLIGVAVPGVSYIPQARNRDEGVYTWYLVTVGQKTGWISGRYLAITGDPNSVPQQGTVFDQIDGAPDVGVVGTTRSVMNFRRRPSARAARLGQLPWGANVQIIGRTIQGGKNFWLQVRYNGQVGWIFAPFVSIRGPIDAVPVR